MLNGNGFGLMWNIRFEYRLQRFLQKAISNSNLNWKQKKSVNLETILSAEATDRHSYCSESSNSYCNEYTTGIAGVSWQRYSIKSGRCKYNGQFDNIIIMSKPRFPSWKCCLQLRKFDAVHKVNGKFDRRLTVVHSP